MSSSIVVTQGKNDSIMPGSVLNMHVDITFCNYNGHIMRSNNYIHIFYLENLPLFSNLIRVILICLFHYKTNNEKYD
jgi:hypothetical protein